LKVAWIILALLFIGILADVARHPASHTTMPTYRLAASQWWAGTDPYSTREHDGFYYFPQAAVVFSPFNLLPGFAGDLAWRLCTFGLFLFALVRLNRVFLAANGAAHGKTFLLLCLLAVPSSMASLRNAQFDLPLAALIVLTACEIATARWTAAAVWLCVAIALKPLAVVPLLLFTALYWRLLPRVAVGLLVVIALPFLHWNPAFVAHEYARCFETLAQAAKANEPRYSDLGALVSRLGYNAPDELKTGVRILFALVYLGLGAMAVRRLKRVEAAWVVGALSADYLMLFNPRTETCSYVFLGPFVASAAVWCLGEPKRRWLGYGLVFAAIGLACDGFPKIETHAFTFSIHDMTDRWLKPLIALLFLPVVIAAAWGKVSRGDDGGMGEKAGEF
jgi:hypothetical protein